MAPSPANLSVAANAPRASTPKDSTPTLTSTKVATPDKPSPSLLQQQLQQQQQQQLYQQQSMQPQLQAPLYPMQQQQHSLYQQQSLFPQQQQLQQPVYSPQVMQGQGYPATMSPIQQAFTQVGYNPVAAATPFQLNNPVTTPPMYANNQYSPVNNNIMQYAYPFSNVQSNQPAYPYYNYQQQPQIPTFPPPSYTSVMHSQQQPQRQQPQQAATAPLTQQQVQQQQPQYLKQQQQQTGYYYQQPTTPTQSSVGSNQTSSSSSASASASSGLAPPPPPRRDTLSSSNTTTPSPKLTSSGSNSSSNNGSQQQSIRQEIEQHSTSIIDSIKQYIEMIDQKLGDDDYEPKSSSAAFGAKMMNAGGNDTGPSRSNSNNNNNNINNNRGGAGNNSSNNNNKNERYQNIYSNYQKHANGIDFQKQFRLTGTAPPVPSTVVSDSLTTGAPEKPVAKITKEGLLYYNVVDMGKQRGTLNDRRWFILREHLLFNHISKDLEPIDVIDLRQLKLHIDIRFIDETNSFRFGVRLVSHNNSLSHFLWSDDPKQTIMWIVVIGPHTLNFDQEKEMEMINQILEISQPESKHNLVKYDEPDVEEIEQQFKILELKQKKQEEQQQMKQKQHNATISAAMRKNTSSQSFFDDIFDPQRKTYKQITKNVDNKDEVIKYISVILNQPEFETGMLFAERIETIRRKVAEIGVKDEDSIKQLKTMVDDVLHEFSQLLINRLPILSKSEQSLLHCRLGVETALFGHIYFDVFEQYTKKYSQEDEEHNNKAQQFLTLTPLHLSIPKKFWLIDQVDGQLTVPYQDAIDNLKKLHTYRAPSEKVQCLIDTSDAICEAIKSFWDRKKDKPDSLVLGADDLLPLFTFVVIKAKIPNMYSEAMFLQDFIEESLSSKMQGYFLVTFQTCLSLLSVWEINELMENASKYFERITSPYPQKEESEFDNNDKYNDDDNNKDKEEKEKEKEKDNDNNNKDGQAQEVDIQPTTQQVQESGSAVLLIPVLDLQHSSDEQQQSSSQPLSQSPQTLPLQQQQYRPLENKDSLI
ncbi:hypothetical protein SAMD00019534_059970 [Acytostelium subglobosum LB1]|uniref:hypothetical protein n=1 Tax=Acytostelium subglobosum LB1 TaxID=1410327 RepID=UPI000644C28E|nr:hypothetical protein SAMD00019534_059970 [Acytostelium subglobosum LB1]GAM22822.1 hypothetical protein SAMD00019534_059970 [Acytostelium subglobosum LB1]|eukprot:XP_012754049.1 hypothetical protein SAMD00019534_059970 [Acytostelium subglobosum LB1]